MYHLFDKKKVLQQKALEVYKLNQKINIIFLIILKNKISSHFEICLEIKKSEKINLYLNLRTTKGWQILLPYF